jgi:hypothetical protein
MRVSSLSLSTSRVPPTRVGGPCAGCCFSVDSHCFLGGSRLKCGQSAPFNQSWEATAAAVDGTLGEVSSLAIMATTILVDK